MLCVLNTQIEQILFSSTGCAIKSNEWETQCELLWENESRHIKISKF